MAMPAAPIMTEVDLLNRFRDILNNAALVTCPRDGCKLTRSFAGYFTASSDHRDTISILGRIHCLEPACGSKLPISALKARPSSMPCWNMRMGLASAWKTAYEAYLRRGNAGADWLIKNFHLARILG